MWACFEPRSHPTTRPCLHLLLQGGGEGGSRAAQAGCRRTRSDRPGGWRGSSGSAAGALQRSWRRGRCRGCGVGRGMRLDGPMLCQPAGLLPTADLCCRPCARLLPLCCSGCRRMGSRARRRRLPLLWARRALWSSSWRPRRAASEAWWPRSDACRGARRSVTDCTPGVAMPGRPARAPLEPLFLCPSLSFAAELRSPYCVQRASAAAAPPLIYF